MTDAAPHAEVSSEPASQPAAEPARLWRVLLLLLGIIVPQAILYWPSLTGQKILLPLDILQMGNLYIPVAPEFRPFLAHNQMLSDEVQVLEPWRRFAVDEARAGRLPLWNPYNFCGAPFLAANQSALFSPFRVLDYLFPGTLVIAYVQVVKSLVAGIGAYLFFRIALRVSFWPALFGACAFPIAAFFIQWRGYPLSHVVAWLPWSLLGVNQAVRSPLGWGGPLLALATAALLVSGHSAMAAQALIGSGLYAAYCLVESFANARIAQRATYVWLPAALVAVLAGWGIGFMLAMPQLLPTAEYMQLSDRVLDRQQGVEETKSVGLSAATQLVMPDIYGSEARGTGYLVVGWNRLESAAAGYAGFLMALVFAPLAFANPKYRWQALFWLLLGLFAASQVLGLPGVREVFRLYPLSVLRNNRLVFLTGWSILAMAVLGFETLATTRLRWHEWFWLPVSMISVFGLYCMLRIVVPHNIVQRTAIEGMTAWFLRAYLTGIALSVVALLIWAAIGRGVSGRKYLLPLGALAVAEVLWFGYGFSPQCDPKLYYPNLPVFDYLRSEPPARMCGEICLPPATGMMHGLRDIRGYDGADPVLYVELIDCFRTYAPQSVRTPYAATCFITPAPSPILDMLNVRHVVYRGIPDPQTKPIFRDDENAYYVLENPTCLPRAFIPRRVKTLSNRQERLAALSERNFDPRELSYVEQEQLLAGPAEGAVEIVSDGNDEVRVRYDMQTEGLLVLADLWDPGWKAYRESTELGVLRVNHALRGVRLPRGQGEIEFRYEPESFYRGLRYCGYGFAALAAWTALVAATWVFKPSGRGEAVVGRL